jgi:hypothetical protein
VFGAEKDLFPLPASSVGLPSLFLHGGHVAAEYPRLFQRLKPALDTGTGPASVVSRSVISA